MHLERVLAVLEHVARADGLRRQLARPARRDEPDAGFDGDRRAEAEAACFGAEHEVGVPALDPRRELADRLPQRLGVGEQRRDVLEADAGSREVLNLADHGAKIVSLRQVSQLAPVEQR